MKFFINSILYFFINFILTFTNSLKNIIPEIAYMETGININPKNEFDAILISEFKTMEDLEKYKNHPEHLKVSALCKSIRVDRQAIDYEI